MKLINILVLSSLLVTCLSLGKDLTERFYPSTQKQKVFGGYITIDLPGIKNPKIYYQLHLDDVVSYTSPQPELEAKPLIFYLGGNLGESALIDGLDGLLYKFDGSSNKFNRITKNGHYVILDPLLGQGFSSSDDKQFFGEDNEVGMVLNKFVTKFFDEYSKLKPCRFYMFGTKYASKFAIISAEDILDQKLYKNISGVILGNPFVNPSLQIPYIASNLYSTGLIDYNLKASFEKDLFKSAQLALQYKYEDSFKLFQQVIKNITDRYGSEVLDDYTQFVKTTKPSYDRAIATYLQKNKDLFGDKLTEFVSFNQSAVNAFDSSYMRSQMDDLDVILPNIRALIFYGTNDLVSGNAAVSDMVYDIDWSDIEAFSKKQKQPFQKSNTLLGYCKQQVTGTVQSKQGLYQVSILNQGSNAFTDDVVRLTLFDQYLNFDKPEIIGCGPLN